MRKRLFLCLFVGCAALLAAQQNGDALESYRSGRELEGRGRTAEADARYREAVTICMNEINTGRATLDTYTVLTWTLQRQKKYNDVLSWGQRALNIRRDYRVIETMGEAYFYLDNYTSSLACMQEYVNALPQGDRAPTAYFFIGEIYRLQRKFHYADIAYTTAVRLDGGVYLWWYRLGLARESAGERSPAIEAYEHSLRLNPSYTQAQDAAARLRGASRAAG